VQNIVIVARVTVAPSEMVIWNGNGGSGPPGTTLPALQVLILDANQMPLPGILVTWTITSGGGSLSPRTSLSNNSGIASTVLTLPSTPGAVRVSATAGGLLAVAFTLRAVSVPILFADSVVDGVTYNNHTPFAGGTVIAMSGENLAEGTATASGTSLPLVLGTTQVFLVSGESQAPLPLFSVSPTQIRALLPPGTSAGTYGLRVDAGAGRSNEVQISVAAFAPAIFTVSENGSGAGVFVKDNGSLVTTSNPAERGSRVTFYAAGLGPVSPPVGDGQPGATAEPLNRTVTVPRVFFDSYAAEMIYSGLAPGAPGRYHVTVRVPTLVSPANNISVSMTAGGFSSNRVTIPVR
jgi:uncharacterized protein (TIGR03437 family)